jgi:hypothetical protein
MTTTYRRCGGLALLAAAAAIGLAACSGGSSAPQVASLGNSSAPSAGSGGGGARSTASGSGNATELLDQWATCIRGHGDPSQADPTVDSNRDIDITMDNVSSTLAGEVHGGTGPCSSYLTAAAAALRGGQSAPQAPSLAVQLKYAECMRANGVPKFPDPNGSQDQYIGNLDPNSPTFENADKVCSKKTDETYYAPGTAPPGVITVRSCNPPPGKQCPAGGPGANGGSGGSGANG